MLVQGAGELQQAPGFLCPVEGNPPLHQAGMGSASGCGGESRSCLETGRPISGCSVLGSQRDSPVGGQLVFGV